MTANVPVKCLFEVSNNMVRSHDSAKKGTPLTEESYSNKESEKQLKFRHDQFISSKYVVSRFKCKIYCWWWLGGGAEKGVEILLVAPCYTNKPEITTNHSLEGPLDSYADSSRKIVVCLKIPQLQWRQSFCLNNKYINEKGNRLSLTHQHDKTFSVSSILSYFFYLLF